MPNPNFLKIVPTNVEFRYPKLDQTYRFNSTERRSETCLPTAQGASWSITWVMNQEEGSALRKLLKSHYDQCRSLDKKLPEFGKIFGSNKEEDGTVTFTARRRGMTSKGEKNNPPRVVDAKKQPLENLSIWSGSKGNIIALAFPTVDPDGVGGISIMLDAVQVVTPVYGSDGLGDFKVEETETATPAAPAAPSGEDW